MWIIIELIHFNTIRGNITTYYVENVLEENIGEKKILWGQKYGDNSIAGRGDNSNGTSDEKDWK